MENKINLSEILDSKYKKFKSTWSLPYVDSRYRTMVLDAMKEACCQTIDLCCDNAELDYYEGGCKECGCNAIDDNSILKTKNQII